ncbi:thioesterase family protein [Aquihabitans sp. McL0605]|uniref:thioesterase family protein n=1 Tax=Aquihabitans sp. McL0605 TaxID=3415671 RepID=UPI003CEE7609
MSTPNILTDTRPMIDGERPDVANSIITDAWGLHFAQGGVVMAAGLRAMEAVLDRPDLSLASASATFCRPVACGPVSTTVEVLRDGRRGSQVLGDLRVPGDDGTNVSLTAVFTDPSLPGPTDTPLPRPVELLDPPPADAPPVWMESAYPLGFLDNTEWKTASSGASAPAHDPVHRLAVWFRFTDPPAAPDADWDPALLPIPGDSLGSALIVALGGGERPVGSVSLQIGIQVFRPMRGTWIGVDSTCTHIANGLASGVLNLWSAAGEHVATVTQTAMLRSLSD